jgi:(2Fe-2S) ferredoxin
MGPPFQRHIFVCTNRRPDDHPKGSCAPRGAEEIRAAFKAELEKRGIKGQMRANAAGCLDTCPLGPTVVIYPEGIWYGAVKLEDVPVIVEEHLIGGRPVERLLMKFQKKEPKPPSGDAGAGPGA